MNLHREVERISKSIVDLGYTWKSNSVNVSISNVIIESYDKSFSEVEESYSDSRIVSLDNEPTVICSKHFKLTIAHLNINSFRNKSEFLVDIRIFMILISETKLAESFAVG